MFHHSYEYILELLDVIKEAARLAKLGKCILGRIPMTDTYAW